MRVGENVPAGDALLVGGTAVGVAMVVGVPGNQKNVFWGTDKNIFVRGGVRTHAHISGPECSHSSYEEKITLESGALI